jgi:hypothetical protein
MALPGPIDQGVEMFRLGKSAEPFLHAGPDNRGDVGHVARPQAPGNCQLNRAIQLLRFPDGLDPIDGHVRVTPIDASATTTAAKQNLRQRALTGCRPGFGIRRYVAAHQDGEEIKKKRYKTAKFLWLGPV